MVPDTVHQIIEKIMRAKSRAAAILLMLSSSPAMAQIITPNPFDFGEVPVGNSSAEQVFTFTNTSPSALQLGSVNLGGSGADQFSMPSQSCAGIAIPPGIECTVSVVFDPSVGGPHVAFIQIDYSSALGGPGEAIANLSGVGGPPVGGPSTDVSLDLSLSMNVVTPGAPVEASVAIANSGPDDAINLEVEVDAPVGATGVSAAGAGWVCGVIGQTATCTRPLLVAAANAPLSVEFNAPPSAGGYSVAASVTSESFDADLSNNDDFENLTVAGVPPAPAEPVPALQWLGLLLLVGSMLVGIAIRR